MKIIYCIAGTYRPGGMERVLANKANYLADKGHEIVIITTDQRGQKPFFNLDRRIRCIDLHIDYELDNGKSLAAKLLHFPVKYYRHRSRLSSALKKEKADIVISMFCNEVSFITNIKDGSKKVLEIHFSKFKRLQYGRKGLWAMADRLISRKEELWARRFDRFVVLTEEDKGYWGAMDNICVIPNARTFTPDSPSPLESRYALAIGRYTYQKGFDILIEMWKLIHEECPEWKLRIVGDGEDRSKLQQMIAAYGLETSVELSGSTDDISGYYKDSSILLMTSRYEGLPMVLLEAQAYGMPIAAFKCKCGPLDVVTDGKDGFLAEEGDIAQLAEKTEMLMKDELLRKRFGKNALAASDRFSSANIMNKWEQLFSGLLSDK